jgi:hypothetical protein
MDLKKLAEGLRLIADAIDPDLDPPTTEPVVAEPKPKAIELLDIQNLAVQLIKAGFKEEFKGYLSRYQLPNLSAADPASYQEMFDSLNAMVKHYCNG